MFAQEAARVGIVHPRPEIVQLQDRVVLAPRELETVAVGGIGLAQDLAEAAVVITSGLLRTLVPAEWQLIPSWQELWLW
jgi:hypothetical protein